MLKDTLNNICIFPCLEPQDAQLLTRCAVLKGIEDAKVRGKKNDELQVIVYSGHSMQT